MKILFINNIHYHRGGAETVYFNTAEVFKSHGHDVTFFSRKDSKSIKCEEDQFFAENYKARKGIWGKIIALFYSFYNFNAAKRVDILLQKEKFDIANIHLMWGGLSPSILKVLRKHNVPIVHTIHDYRIVCPTYTFRKPNGEICESCSKFNTLPCIVNRCSKNSIIESVILAMEFVFRNTLFPPEKLIDGFIYVSYFSKNKHIQCNKQLDNAKCCVIYNMVMPLEKQAIEQEFSERYFLFSGRLSKEKGLPTLIEAFEKLPHIPLYIAGDGPLRNYIEDYIKDKKITNIKLLGFLSAVDMQRINANAKCLVVPSECYENNPMVILESYFNSVPVIGASIGGIPEIIINSKTGYLFEVGNVNELIHMVEKMNKLNQQEWLNLSKYCLSFAQQKFTSEQQYIKILNFYQEVIRSYKPNK